MDFFGTIPMEHKNQACFMTPQLNNFTTHLKEKNVGTVNSATNLINHLNQQNQQSNLGIKNVVQKTSLDQNSDFNYNLTGFNYDTSNVKIENDSNESDISDNRNNFNFSDLRFKMDNCYNLNDHSNINGQNLGVNISLNYGLKNSKRGSGRRPSNLKEDKLTPEEEERRRIRRERNKEAAARCRKRRVEHTNNLEKETQSLEEKKQLLQLEIQKLKNESEQLLFLLRNHECKLNFNVS